RIRGSGGSWVPTCHKHIACFPLTSSHLLPTHSYNAVRMELAAMAETQPALGPVKYQEGSEGVTMAADLLEGHVGRPLMHGLDPNPRNVNPFWKTPGIPACPTLVCPVLKRLLMIY